MFDELDKKEKIFFSAGFLLLVIVVGSSLYLYINPPVQTLEAKIFDSFQDETGWTWVWTYGKGKIKLNGLYDFEPEETYKIVYQSRERNQATVVISVEKIS